jgi:Predicted metal-binding integral membrane protein
MATGRLLILSDRWLTASLLAGAAVGWWWSVRMSGDMESMLRLPAFMVAWLAMMVAMMLPAVGPVVNLYRRTARGAGLAPLPVFLAGYLAVWSAAGLPAYLGWRGLIEPLTTGATWAGRLAGGVFLAAAAYQLTPLKSVCLEHCVSPLQFFLTHAQRLGTRRGAVISGAHHGLWCFGCCWALMASLVALGAMQPVLMAGVAALIYTEKATQLGRQATPLIAAMLAGGGGILLVHPHLVIHLP